MKIIRGFKYKYLILASLIILFGLNFLLANYDIKKVYAQDNNLVICAYGDSIAYGETLADLTKAYPSVFALDYKNTYNAEFFNYGVSGDTSTMLLDKLNNEGINNDADIITLCIGANNILGCTTSYLESLLLDQTGDVKTKYQSALNSNVSKFNEDYAKILNKFNGKKVVVMTIYNPYGDHSTLADINISSIPTSYQSMISSILNQYDVKFKEIIEMSMSSLQQINDTIRQSASDSVSIVDIWQLFNGLTKEQYKTYINSDLTKISLKMTDLMPIMQGNFAGLISKVISGTDPHPTLAGHAFIAAEHTNVYKPFKLKAEIPNTVYNTDYLTFMVDTVIDKNFEFHLYKNGNLLYDTTNKNISIKSTEVEGINRLYVKVYLNNNLVYTTDEISVNINISEKSDDNINQPPKEDSIEKFNLKEFVIKYKIITIVFVVLSSLAIVLIFKSIIKLNNKNIKWK